MNEPRPGDWVCFKQLGIPCYAKVEYIYKNDGSRAEYVTTAGTCFYDDILEVRTPE